MTLASPVNLHPKIEGVWARQIAAFGEVEIEHAWPHGNESASWAFPPGTSHKALHAGASVEIFDGGLRVWKGILQEPGLDGAMKARGLWSEGLDALAIDSVARFTTNPDYAVNDGIARGALTWKTTRGGVQELPSAAISTDANVILSVSGLLDAWAAKEGKRWGIDPDGNLRHYADPTTPSWHVPHAAAGRGLTPADDDFATHLYGIYNIGGDERGLVTVGDADAQTAYGRRVERTVDLTNLGPIPASQATTALQNTLALAATRLRFADGLDLTHGQITTPGGAPAPLSQVRAGQVVRLHGVKDPRGVNGIRNYTDVLIGKSTFRTETQTLSIAPVNAAPRGLEGVNSGGAASGVDAASPSMLKPLSIESWTVGAATHSPNDGAWRTVWHLTPIGIPSGAVLAQVSMSWVGVNSTNAQNHYSFHHWSPSGWVALPGEYARHNGSNPALAMGGTTTFTIDVRSLITSGTPLQLAINVNNDPGSGSWTHNGHAGVTITWLG